MGIRAVPGRPAREISGKFPGSFRELSGTKSGNIPEAIQEMFEILEARAAEDAAREAAESATPPVRTSTPVRRPEQESSATATPLAVNTTSCG